MSVIKRSLSIILVVSMLLSMFTFVSYASETTDNDNFETIITQEDSFPLEYVETDNKFAEEDEQENTFDEETVPSVETPDSEENISELEPESGIGEEQKDPPAEEDKENDISSDEYVESEITEPDDNDETETSELESEAEVQEDALDIEVDNSYTDEKSSSYETSKADDDEDISVDEAELMIDWLYKDRTLEAAVNGAVARKEPDSSSKVMKTYSVGDYIKIVDRKITWYGYVTNWYKTNEGYWIYGSNLRYHTHDSVSSSATKTECDPKNNKQHIVLTTKIAVLCRCEETIQKEKKILKQKTTVIMLSVIVQSVNTHTLIQQKNSVQQNTKPKKRYRLEHSHMTLLPLPEV